MAAMACATPTPPLCRLPPHLRRSRCIRCFAGRRDGGEGAPSLLKAVVSGVTEVLRTLTPRRRRREDLGEEQEIVVRSIDDVLLILRSDYERAYFLTGNFTSYIYAEDCLFEDPTIKFRGKGLYSQNLDLLVPFFDSPSLELEKIEKGCNSEMDFILAAWKLRTYLNFPWRPLISIRGTTIYDLNGELKIVRHAESWNVSALEAVGQIFKFGSREDAS